VGLVVAALIALTEATLLFGRWVQMR